MDVPKSKVEAMLSEVDENQRDAFLEEFKRRGYRMVSDAPTSNPGSYLQQLQNSALGQKGGAALDYLANVGKSVNRGNQALAGDLMSGAGQAESRLGLPQSSLTTPAMMAALPLSVASEVAMPKDRLSAALTVGSVAAEPLAAGVSAATDAASPLAQRALTGLYKIMPNVYPSTAKYLLNNWDAVMNAPKVEQARDLYAAAAGGLKHWTASLGERFGTLTPSNFTKHVVADAQAFLEGKGAEADMTPQKALDAIQSINLEQRSMATEVKDATMRAQKNGEFNLMKDKLYDYLETNGAPALRAAGKTLRNAFVRDEVMSLLPRNKAGDANVLRGLVAADQFATGISRIPEQPIRGTLQAGAGLAFSPAMFTGTLNQGKALTNIISTGPGNLAANMTLRAALAARQQDQQP